ncbi:hypothetical protein D3C81_2099410 [compost metagenome]
MPDPTQAGRFKCGIQGAVMCGEIETVEMAMGIYEHKRLELHPVRGTVDQAMATGRYSFMQAPRFIAGQANLSTAPARLQAAAHD